MLKKEEYCKYGIYDQNEKIILMQLSVCDLDLYMKASEETSEYKGMYKNEMTYNILLKQALVSDDELILSIYGTDDNEYKGYISLQNLNDDVQEIGINIVEKYRKMGIGTAAVHLLTTHEKNVNGKTRLNVRIMNTNIASQKLFHKFGAVKVGESESLREKLTRIFSAMDKSVEDINRDVEDIIGDENNGDDRTEIYVIDL